MESDKVDTRTDSGACPEFAAEDTKMCPVADSAVSFLNENSHFRSTSVLERLRKGLAKCEAKGDLRGFYLFPIREKMLGLNEALLWILFLKMHPFLPFDEGPEESAAKPAENGQSFWESALETLPSVYDIDYESLISTHWTPDSDSDDSDSDDSEGSGSDDDYNSKPSLKGFVCEED